MTVHRLTEQSGTETKKLLTRILPLIILATIPAFVMMYTVSKEFPLAIIIASLTVMSAIIVGLTLAIKQRSSIVITLDDNTLTCRRSGRVDTIIHRDEVKRITEDNDGDITVLSIDPAVRMHIPRGIENYNQFKTALSAWKLIEKSQQSMLMPYLLGISLVVISVGAFMFRQKEFFYLFAAYFGIFFLYQFASNIKSILVVKDNRKRASLALSLLIFIYLIYVIIDSFIS